METAGNPVIIDAFRKSGVVSLHHIRGILECLRLVTVAEDAAEDTSSTK